MAGGSGPSEVELNHNMADQGQGTLRRQMLEKQRREMLVRPLNPISPLNDWLTRIQDEFERQKQALVNVRLPNDSSSIRLGNMF